MPGQRPEPVEDYARIAATSLGVVLGAVLLGMIGAWSGNTWLGASTGGLLGGLVGRGAVVGTVGPTTACALLFALFFTILGSSVDDYGGQAALPGAVLGAFVGWLLWRSPRRVK